MSQQTPQPGSQQTPQPGYQPPNQPVYQPPNQPVHQPQSQPVYQPPTQPGYQHPYAQPVYQQTVVYSTYQPQPKGLSITSLVLGLVSIFFGFTFLVPIGAVIFGAIGIKREPTGRGMSITGLVLGGLCLLGCALLVVLWVVFAGMMVGAAASSGGYNS